MTGATLISFLGRTPKGENGRYRTTVYRFADGQRTQPIAFFGWGLARRLAADHLVILGTTGSMWDHLFEGDIDLGDAAEAERTRLIEAVQHQCVDAPMLAPLAPLLAEQLGCRVSLDVIPYARDEAEQTALLSTMARHIQAGDTVHLDVTHGFRHLPMLALLAALHLRVVRGARIGGIWYGAYDPDTGDAPVLELSGLLNIADWLQALYAFDKDGDYGVFAPLLPQLAQPLREAAFLEQINRVGQARGKARQSLGALEAALPDPAAELFRGALRDRLSWAAEDRLYQRQRALARQYLERGQFLQAIVAGYEAFITGLVQQAGGQPENAEDRQQARDAFDEAERRHTPRRAVYQAWDTLRRLRNTVVHGNQARGGDVQRALASPEAMTETLRGLFDVLLPEQQ